MQISHGILISSTPDQIPDEELESFSESGPIARFFQSSEPHDPHPAAPRRGKGERIVEAGPRSRCECAEGARSVRNGAAIGTTLD